MPLTTGVVGILPPSNGGTGVNNGASTLTLGGSLMTAGAFTSTFTMTGNTSVTFPTSGTLATTAQLPTPSPLTEVDDTNVTMTLGGSPATALLQAVSMTLGWSGQLSLTRGGTNASLTADNGGIIYSTATALDILAPTVTPNHVLLSGSSAAPFWSSAIYPFSTVANELLYSNTTDSITGLATINSAVLVSTAAGIPGFTSSMTDGQVVIGATGGTPIPSSLTAGTNISITNGSNSITISAIGAGVVPSPLTEVDDTNVTMTLGGIPAISLLQPVSLTLGWAGQLSLTRGGTNSNLIATDGAMVYSTATALVLTPALTDGQVVIGATAGPPIPSTLTAGTNISITNASNSITINAIGAGVTPSALTEIDDTNVTMTLGGTPATALLQAVSMTLGWTGQLSMARGGTNANLTATQGIVFSTASAMSILPSAAGAALVTSITGAPTFTSHMLDGQIVIGRTTGTPGAANLTAGTNITITNAPGSITISAAGSGVTPAALTEVNDTNVTMTLGGTPATALLQAVSMTLGWTGTLSPIRGGTGVNNGASTLTLGGSLTTSGAFTSTFTMTGATAVTFPTTGTLATTAQLPTPAALTEVNDTNVTMTLGGTPATALLQAVSMTLGWTGQLSMARGGTNANLTATQGIVFSTASAMSILPSAAGAALVTSITGAPTFTSHMLDGQIVIGRTTGTPGAANLTAGTNITITNAPGSITISATGSGGAGGLIAVQVFKTSGTYTPTSGMANCLIQVLAGGGAGGGVPAGNIALGTAAGGGGAGGYSQSYVPSATIGASQAVTIGAGGTGVSNSAGNNGSDSSVGAIVIAKGGTGSPVGTGATGNVTSIGGVGGIAGTGDITFPGGAGNWGWSDGGGGVTASSGMGGNSYFSSGAINVTSTNSAGVNAGANTGAGGSGACSAGVGSAAQAGGNAGSGLVIIYEYS